jgi:hypothetical protein
MEERFFSSLISKERRKRDGTDTIASWLMMRLIIRSLLTPVFPSLNYDLIALILWDIS